MSVIIVRVGEKTFKNILTGPDKFNDKHNGLTHETIR